MDDLEKEKLLEEKRNLEENMKTEKYQKENKDEDEIRCARWCRIAIILLLASIFLFGSIENDYFENFFRVIRFILFIYIINCKIKYPHNTSVNVCFGIILAFGILILSYIVLFAAVCYGFVYVLDSCSGMPG